MLNSKHRCNHILLFLFITNSHFSHADGSTIDKIYHSYVELLEWEAEWRMVQENKNPITEQKRRQLHKFGLGKAVSETVFIEAYIIAEKHPEDKLSIEAYELEVLWQLSEQGEFIVDYGLLLELEKNRGSNTWEYATSLLLEKEYGRISATANLSLIYEWGDIINNEWETSIALQTRYRHSPRFEPAFELYAGEGNLALGPVITGMERLGKMRAMRWQLGSIFGLNNDTADYTLRAVLEYEF